MSEQPQNRPDTDNGTDLDELNDTGVGATLGEDTTFEPEDEQEAYGHA